jgi:hypothetical protein
MSKEKKCKSLEIVLTYSNEITHINMCMKLERHKFIIFLKRTQRFQKTFLKIKRFVSLSIS